MREWLSVKQVAAMFGVDVSTTYRWISSGLLPAWKIGRRYRVRMVDAENFAVRVEPTRLPPPEVRRRQDIEEVVEGLRRQGYDVT